MMKPGNLQFKDSQQWFDAGHSDASTDEDKKARLRNIALFLAAWLIVFLATWITFVNIR